MIEKNFALKEGDRVLVYATVKYDRRHAGDGAFLMLDGRYSTVTVEMEAIHRLVKPKLEVGDAVEVGDGRGEILARTETHAWVVDGLHHRTVALDGIKPIREPLKEIELVEAALEPPPAAEIAIAPAAAIASAAAPAITTAPDDEIPF